MQAASFANRANLEILEAEYQRWQQDPKSVDERWQAFFEGLELGSRSEGTSDAIQAGVAQLIYEYRDIGHTQAHLDPLSDPPSPNPLLALSQFGLAETDLDRTVDASGFDSMGKVPLRELVAALRETYSRSVGVEFLHIQDPKIRQWIKDRIEARRMRPSLPLRQKLRTLMTLHYAEMFEAFLHTRYQGSKRFSLEGSETLIPILDAICQKAPSLQVREFIIGMAHRGRLNVLANILHKPYQEIFAEFEDNFLPNSIDGDGDVKYHLGFAAEFVTSSGERVHLSLAPNPSHLEAVDPVVEGRTRAKQRLFGDKGRMHGIPLLIHGDAAVAGQGVVAETLNLAHLEGYTTGGTIHIVINNLIGFTTNPSDARSTAYCTDVGKMIQAPIFHVNGEDPEACVWIAELALEFRQTFNRDIFIDMYCYRRRGHNEGDEPAFTQPVEYEKIRSRPTIGTVYTQQLVSENALKQAEAQAIQEEFKARLNDEQHQVKEGPPRKRIIKAFTGMWKHLQGEYSHAPADTAVGLETLKHIATLITQVPEGVTPHKGVEKVLRDRREMFANNRPIDWAFAEALAFGTLVNEGKHVRLTGQDSRRGTFSQRHAVVVDSKTGKRYVPLNNLPGAEGLFSIYDSLLSEVAVLGFEFGYSLDAPDALVLWEAQFGDFVNGAQAIIDQFICSSESKWQRSSGLVMLLPHGYEGQGPEHSSARLERFLQLCAEDNIQVCYPTTAGQYFHVLRRQLKRPFRKPLIVMTPKSMLRYEPARSPISELTNNRFMEVLDDTTADGSKVKRVILCSGKVYYDLIAPPGLDGKPRTDLPRSPEIAIIRVEQFYPFPEEQLRKVLSRYKQAKDYVWVQEESQNMGGWTFMEPRLRQMKYTFNYVGRDASASPAVGSLKTHQREQAELVEAALRRTAPYAVASANGHGMKSGEWRVTSDERRVASDEKR